MNEVTPETWRAVVGYEGLYEVSDLGQVRSLPRQTTTGLRGGKILSGSTGGAGAVYRTVRLCNGGQVAYKSPAVTKSVHRLVLEAFVGPCPEGQEGLHGPGGHNDNRLANLSWGTKAKNHGHDECRDGICRCGERAWQSILSWPAVAEIKRRLADGAVRADLAREYGVSWSTVDAIKRGRTWHHQPG